MAASHYPPQAFAALRTPIGVEMQYRAVSGASVTHLKDELRGFQKDLGVRRHRFGEPDVAADDRTGSDHRVSAQNGRSRVDDDVVFEGWMALLVAVAFTGVPGQGQGAEGDSLVESHAVADFSGFADHHAGPMVNEKALPNVGSRVDIDSCQAVSVLAHDAGQEGHFLVPELMSRPVNRDGKEPRVAEDDLVVAPGCRIAFVCGTHIRRQQSAQGGERFDEGDGDLLAAIFTADTGEIVADAVVTQGQRHLFREAFKEGRRLLPEVVTEVELFEPGADKIAGIENPGNPLHDVDDGIAGGDGFRADMIEAFLAIAGMYQPIYHAGDFLAELSAGGRLRKALILS